MSITIVKYKAGVLPISERSIVHVVFIGDEEFYRPLLWSRHFKHGRGRELKGWGESEREDIFIFAIFSEVAAFKGRSSIDVEERQQIIELIRKANKAIIISFGSPYILSHFKEADILIAAYDGGDQAQEAVIRCLKGETDFRGETPVKIQV